MARSTGSTAQASGQRPHDLDPSLMPRDPRLAQPQAWAPYPHQGQPHQGQPQPGQPPQGQHYQQQPYPPQQGYPQQADPYAQQHHQQPTLGYPGEAPHTGGQPAQPRAWTPQFEPFAPGGQQPVPQHAAPAHAHGQQAPAQAYAPQQAYEQPGFAHDPRTGGQSATWPPQPQQQPAAPQGYPPQAYADPHAQQAYAPAQAPQAYAQPTHGYGAPAAPQPPFQHHPEQGGQRQDTWPPQPDPQTWDLSQYSPGQPADPGLHGGHGHPQAGYAEHDPYGRREPTAGYAAQDAMARGQPAYGHEPQWGAPGAPHDPGLNWQQGQAADPRFDQGYPAPQAGYDPAQQDQQYAYDEPAEEEPEPKRGSRMMLVAGVLVGAIVMGGGLAWGYKRFMGPSTPNATPVVRNSKDPVKVKPAEPGGKDVANIDKKFLNRLAEGGAGGTSAQGMGAAPQADAEGGSRKVTTLVVNRDGTLTPQGMGAQPVAAAPPPPPAPISSGVPGMVIEGLNTPPMPPQPPPRAAARAAVAEPVAPAAAPPAAAPKVADLPLPKVRGTAAPVPKKKVAARDDAAAAAPATPRGANGYVPVLTSSKSREDALRTFADMHQKYGGVLEGRVPDVREANLGEKGVWYRLIVGPPGSRESANDICAKLKAQGYQGCWPMAY